MDQEIIPLTHLAVKLWKDTPNKPEGIKDDFISMHYHIVPEVETKAEYGLVKIEDALMDDKGVILEEAKYEKQVITPAVYKKVTALPEEFPADDGWQLKTNKQFNDYNNNATRKKAIETYQKVENKRLADVKETQEALRGQVMAKMKLAKKKKA